MSYRFAIVGCGRIAEKHARIAAEKGRLQAVCDILPDKAARLAQTHHCKAYKDLNTLLQQEAIDVVCICTPNGTHEELAVLALHKGCHVLCEKPMTLSVDSGRRMMEASRQSGRKLYVVKQNRFNPPVQAVKNLLDEKKLGKILAFQLNGFWHRPAAYYQDSWRGSSHFDGGTLFTQFSHFIDLLAWFLGDLKAVKGNRQNQLHQGLIDFEDQGAALLEMENGARGILQYTVNTHQKNMEGSFTLFGEKGTIKIGGQYLNRLDYFNVEGVAVPSLPDGPGSNQYGFYEGSMSNHDQVYTHLIAALEQGSSHLVEAEEALKCISIIEAIYKASPLE